MKMSIARAMKEKSRMVQKMNELSRTFSGNVYLERAVPSVNVADTYRQFVTLHRNVTTLKKMIARANVESGASDIIITLTESKYILAALRLLRTDTESEFRLNPINGDMEETKKKAFLSFEEVEAEKQKYQKLIYDLQDKLDELNATHFIDFCPYED